MSEAKREQSQFLHAAAQVPPRSGARCARPPSASTTTVLSLAEPWAVSAAQGTDPYNAVGARATRSPRARA